MNARYPVSQAAPKATFYIKLLREGAAEMTRLFACCHGDDTDQDIVSLLSISLLIIWSVDVYKNLRTAKSSHRTRAAVCLRVGSWGHLQNMRGQIGGPSPSKALATDMTNGDPGRI